jgi:prophage regulatory protein
MSDGLSGPGMRVIALGEVRTLTGLGKSTIYDLIREKDFPPPIPLTLRKRGWILQEVENWVQDRRAARDGETLRKSGWLSSEVDEWLDLKRVQRDCVAATGSGNP